METWIPPFPLILLKIRGRAWRALPGSAPKSAFNGAVPKSFDAVPKSIDAVPKSRDAVLKSFDAVPNSFDAVPKSFDAVPK